MFLNLILVLNLANYCSLSGVPRKMLSAAVPFTDAKRVEGCLSRFCRANGCGCSCIDFNSKVHTRNFSTNNKRCVTKTSARDSGVTSDSIDAHLTNRAALDDTIGLRGCATVHGLGFVLYGLSGYIRGKSTSCGRCINRTCCFHT